MSLEALLSRDPDAVLRLLDKADAAESLSAFIRMAWPIIEPGQPYVHGWHLDAISEHLEAVTAGQIQRLLINIPPGMMKSLQVGVFWPCWEWGPKGLASMRYVCASHAQDLAVRDNLRARRLLASDWYQERWGEQVHLTRDQNAKIKFENLATGFRQAAAAGSITGARGDRVIIDDPHSVEGASSEAMRQSVVDWFLEAVPTRLNNPKTSAIVVVMQRLHEDDVSGVILSKDLGYEHLMLPMEFEPQRKCVTSIGFEDPRTTDGELLFPERFPAEVVARDAKAMGKFAAAGQFQQSPIPRGGGILRADDWRLWDEASYPPFDYIVASLDGAFTEKQENDYSALTIWGMWNEQAGRRIAGSPMPTIVQDHAGATRIMLMYAWQKRLEMHGRYVPQIDGESEADWIARQKAEWGLVEHVADACRRHNVDRLLIEAKASGHTVSQEIRRLIPNRSFGVELIDPGRVDKWARAWAVQHMLAEGMIYAPDRKWADEVIQQCASFPKGKHDDLVDSSIMAWRHLRDTGIARSTVDRIEDTYEAMQLRKPTKPLYPV